MAKKRATNPWQIASERMVDLRYEIDRILDDFSEEDKKSKNYRDLMETLNLLMEHALSERDINKYRSIKKKGVALSMVAVGAMIGELVKRLVDIIGALL